MCPACLVSAALIAGGVTTGGAVTALIVRKILHRRPGKKPKAMYSRRS